MDFSEYQKSASITANKSLAENESLICSALGLTGEAGEFADLVKKWRYQGHDFDFDKAKKELGDVLWYLALAASSMGLSLDDVAQTNIDKLKARYNGEFTAAKSVNRQTQPLPALFPL